MKIVFIGCIDRSQLLLEKLLAHPDAEVVGVVTKTKSAFNADFASLEGLAKARGIPCYCTDLQNGQQLTNWMAELSPDVAYCFGWSQLLPSEVLTVPRLGVIGFHPTKLPANRGRHPLIWALVLGLEESASSFFFMDEGADSGDILSQVSFPITEDDDALSLNQKVTVLALRQMQDFTTQLASGVFPRTPQNHRCASSWRKRSKLDGVIDWRMSARSIHNLVRALTHPYPAANGVLDGKSWKVWKTVLENDSADPNAEPGKVLGVHDGEILVKCGEGVIRLVKHELDPLPEEGSYL